MDQIQHDKKKFDESRLVVIGISVMFGISLLLGLGLAALILFGNK